jgi:hypothetical protein
VRQEVGLSHQRMFATSTGGWYSLSTGLIVELNGYYSRNYSIALDFVILIKRFFNKSLTAK